MTKGKEGKEADSQHFSHKTQADFRRFLEQGADKMEITPAPAQKGDGQIEADLSLLDILGIGKKGEDHRQPEEKIQDPPQQPEGDPPSEKAEDVVQKTGPKPQKDGPGEGDGLGLYRDRHPRNRRERRPPPRTVSSS